MSGSVAIDVALGLIFTYFVFSSLCSGISEVIAQVLNSRGKALFSSINALIGDANLARQFWQHDLVRGMVKVRASSTAVPIGMATMAQAASDQAGKVERSLVKILPSYLSASTFATTILDLVTADPPVATAAVVPGVAPTAGIPGVAPTAGISGVAPTTGIQGVVNAMAATAEGDAQRLQASMEKWFNDAMDRLSGWYKRRVKLILLGLAVAVTVGFNVSTVRVAEELWRQPELRAAVTAQAQQTTATTATTTPSVQKSLQDAATLPVGWGVANRRFDHWQWLWMIVGWVLTGGALTMGAPFWFDLLTRFNSLRSTGPPPAK